MKSRVKPPPDLFPANSDTPASPENEEEAESETVSETQKTSPTPKPRPKLSSTFHHLKYHGKAPIPKPTKEPKNLGKQPADLFEAKPQPQTVQASVEKKSKPVQPQPEAAPQPKMVERQPNAATPPPAKTQKKAKPKSLVQALQSMKAKSKKKEKAGKVTKNSSSRQNEEEQAWRSQLQSVPDPKKARPKKRPMVRVPKKRKPSEAVRNMEWQSQLQSSPGAVNPARQNPVLQEDQDLDELGAGVPPPPPQAVPEGLAETEQASSLADDPEAQQSPAQERTVKTPTRTKASNKRPARPRGQKRLKTRGRKMSRRPPSSKTTQQTAESDNSKAPSAQAGTPEQQNQAQVSPHLVHSELIKKVAETRTKDSILLTPIRRVKTPLNSGVPREHLPTRWKAHSANRISSAVSASIQHAKSLSFSCFMGMKESGNALMQV